jgi:hypothetical protein
MASFTAPSAGAIAAMFALLLLLEFPLFLMIFFKKNQR